MTRTALLTALIWIVSLSAADTGQGQSQRRMPFLCRNAVVRESAQRVVLVQRGQPGPQIIVGGDVSGPQQGLENEHLQRAATTLANYLQKITGVKCAVVKHTAAPVQAHGMRIFLETEGHPAQAFPELAQADAHGFLIATRTAAQGVDLHIVGASGTGTLYGAWFFLTNYAGLRIVLPGEIGEVYAPLDRLEIPKDLYLFNPQPDYLLRIWSGEGGMDPLAWLADHGATQRFQYHHNMRNIYPPERFGATHPEFYPVKEGKPAVPDPRQKSAWQPTFSEPAVARRAIEYADELFTQNPQMKSVSLSVNDGLGYSEADMRKGQFLPDGSLTISEIYYSYVNTVARAIRARWPDKCVAFFPYNLAKTPPSFALEDNVILFLLNEPKTTYAAWQGKVKHIGVYQWLYGMGWVIPNHWPHAMQDYLRWVRQHGGQAFKGEAYVAWAPDGPRMWVLCNLLWNVDADVDALLDDYYQHAYGPEAAPAMARYFAQAEKIYERRRTPEEYRITIHRPGERQFAQARAEDFQVMAQALAEAEQAARGAANRRRVDLVARAFRWGQSYWQQCDALRRIGAARIGSEADVQALLQCAASFDAITAQRREYFRTQIEPLAPYCVYGEKAKKPSRNDVEPDFKWEGRDEAMDRGCVAITAFQRTSHPPEQVAAFWSAAARRYPALQPFADCQRLMVLYPGAELANLLSNGSFEQPPEPAPADGKPPPVARDWNVYHNRMVSATVRLDAAVKHDGRVSVTAQGLTDYSGLIRSVRVPNHARYRLSFWYRTSPQTRHAVCALLLRPDVRLELPAVESWTKIERTFTVNSSAGKQAGFTLLLCLRHGGSPQSQVWFDDVRLERLAPEGRLVASSAPRVDSPAPVR